MQVILSIDATSSPATAVVSKVEGSKVEVLETLQCNLDALFASAATPEAPVDADAAPIAAVDQPKAEAPAENPLKTLLASITNPWTSAVLLIPPNDYISLNIELPFKDPKALGRVLDLEVQDRVPFEVEDFFIEHRAVAEFGTGMHDIHVSIIGRSYLESILSQCRKSGFEPVIVSTPASALGAIFHLGDSSLAANTAVLFAREPYYYLTSRVSGEVRCDRIIFAPPPNPNSAIQTEAEVQHQDLLTQLRLTIGAFELRYKQDIEQVVLVGNHFKVPELKKELGKNVTQLNLKQFFGSNSDDSNLACLASVFAQEKDAPSILTNFRSREFSYSPRLGEIFGALRPLLPWALGTIFLALATLIGIWFVHNYQIEKIQGAIRDEVEKILPGKLLAPGSELKTLQSEIAVMEEQLKDFGSPSRSSLLEALLELTNSLPLSEGITFRKLTFQGNRVKIEGTAPRYASVVSIEKALAAKKTTYCQVKRDTSNANAAGTSYPFTIDVWLCE